MEERDAFGRVQGEDSLSEMGWRPAATPAPGAWEAAAVPPTPAPAPAADAAAAAAQAATPAPAPAPLAALPSPPPLPLRPAPTQSFVLPPRRRRRRPGLAGLFVLIAILVGGYIGVSAAFDAGRKAIDGIPGAIDSIKSPKAVAVPKGDEPGSLLRSAALTNALDRLPTGRLQYLRVAPGRIDARVVKGHTLHTVQVTSDLRVQDTESRMTGSVDPALPVTTAAPLRVARAAARRSHRAVADVSYLVLLRTGGGAEWHLYFGDGRHYSADTAGRHVKKVG
jgi:hypothetical protein